MIIKHQRVINIGMSCELCMEKLFPLPRYFENDEI